MGEESKLEDEKATKRQCLAASQHMTSGGGMRSLLVTTKTMRVTIDLQALIWLVSVLVVVSDISTTLPNVRKEGEETD